MFKDILADVFPVLEKVAPTFASVLGSPIAGMATTVALQLIATKFGLDPKQVTSFAAAMGKDPECNDKLCQLEEDYGGWFKEHFNQLRMPSKAEVNVKVEWDNVPSSS